MDVVEDHKLDDRSRQSSVTGFLVHLLLVDLDEVKHGGEIGVD